MGSSPVRGARLSNTSVTTLWCLRRNLATVNMDFYGLNYHRHSTSASFEICESVICGNSGERYIRKQSKTIIRDEPNTPLNDADHVRSMGGLVSYLGIKRDP